MSKRKYDQIELENYPTIVHQFWLDMNHKPNNTIELPQLAYLSIKSFIMQGYMVKLWTYHSEITNIPKDCVVCDANTIISLKQYQKWNVHTSRIIHNRPHIAQFVDLFRVKVVYKYGGWWADIDMICLRKLPNANEKGIILASSPNKMSSPRCYHKSDVIDGQFSNTIFYATKNHQFLKKVIKLYEQRFERNEFPTFIVLMVDMYMVAKKEEYLDCVYHPHDFVPFPWWNNKPTIQSEPPKHELTHHGYKIPTIEYIKKYSYTFNYYKKILNDLENAPKTSAIWNITEHIEQQLDEKFILDFWDH